MDGERIGASSFNSEGAQPVAIHVTVSSLSEINTAAEMFVVNVELTQSWLLSSEQQWRGDPSIFSEERSVHACLFDQINFPGSRQVTEVIAPKRVNMYAEQDVYRSAIARYKLELKAPLNLTNFPFDCQTLPIHVVSSYGNVQFVTRTALSQWESNGKIVDKWGEGMPDMAHHACHLASTSCNMVSRVSQ